MRTQDPHEIYLDTRAKPSSSQPGSANCQIIGHPEWVDPRLSALASQSGNAAALAEAWRQKQSGCLELLDGAYSLAIFDAEKGRFLAATDRLGRSPLYFRQHDQGIEVASCPTQLANHNTSLSRQGLFNYIYFHMVPAPSTIFTGIEKLKAGEALSGDILGPQRFHHWIPNFGSDRSTDERALAERLRTCLRDAVRSSLPESGRVGAFLSGGLDSSTVAGLLAETKDQSADAFAIGFDAAGYDEMPYARLTARHFGLRLHEYYVTPEDIVRALPDLMRSFTEPFGNSSALPALFCAQMARDHGIDTMLAGDGGDEMFAGNERYAQQKLFGLYSRVPSTVRRGLIEPLVSVAPHGLPLVSKARSYIRQANVPLPDRLQTYNFLSRHPPEELFSAEFLAEIDIEQPLSLLRSTFNLPSNGSSLDRMLYLDWQFTLADNDLRKVGQACANAGVIVRYPMLDDNLLRLSIEVPDHLKLRGRKLRHFYKKALSGWLPHETISKRKHGFGLPFGVWLQSHPGLKALAQQQLYDLKQRSLLRSEFIEFAIDVHKRGHASYYGELIWILMALELWLKHHA